jgi:hypothetical protein
MKYRMLLRVFVLIVILVSGPGFLPITALAQGIPDSGALARIEVRGPLQEIRLPVYAHLCDATGNEYALVITPIEHLYTSGLVYRTIDSVAIPGSYLLALERRKGSREAAAQRFEILLDDGRHILVRNGSGVPDKLAKLGFDLQVLPDKPISLRAAPLPLAPAITYDALIAAMIDQVQSNTVYDENGNLSGENQVTIGGSPYTITTRHTGSGTPIQLATQYVYERMETMGLTVSYHDWSACSRSNRNVIGAKAGIIRPDEIVLITAHLDDMPASGSAPGADDNASGSAGVLIAANIMSPNDFERTVRFVFFTGEEQGLCGSGAYASMVDLANEKIVAVYNMDMIAWDAINGSTLRLHTRPTNNPGYQADVAIANLFSEVVDAYGLSSGLTPIIDADGIGASDHASFWQHGFAGILAIEDDVSDFNIYYHTSNDQRQYLNMDYFTNFVKASVGTAAHLAFPFTASNNPVLYAVRSGQGSGSVTSNPPGIDCGRDCLETYQSGTVVTLTATADPGFAFGGWNGAGCSGTETCVVTLYGDITITATFDVPPRLSVSEGTIGTDLTIYAGSSGFGTKKGKVFIGNTAAKIINWADTAINCNITKVPLPASVNDVTIKVQPYKTATSFLIDNAFTVMGPVIDDVIPDFGSPGKTITIRGRFFSTKKPKVYLGDKKCKVISWEMNSATGNSTITFEVPKNMAPVTYDVTVANKVGAGTQTAGFTINDNGLLPKPSV